MTNQQPPKIVVVDDDADTAAFLCDFFAMLGLDTRCCLPGPRVAACIGEHRPQVVVLDVQLDGMTGVDVLHQLRADPAMRTTPIIFFSGSADKLRLLLPDYAARGAMFVRKPNVEPLAALVTELAQRST